MDKIVILDLKGIESADQFNNLVSKKLNFPDYYGKNKDAFWECLCHDVPAGTTIHILNYEKKDIIESYIKILLEAEKEREKFKVIFI